ncbi:MAG: rRNA adenine N-6-methyltransferase family protein [Candidatus Aenigmatarchaeota archaeon]
MEIRNILKKYNLSSSLNEREDQHFMEDEEVIAKMIEYGEIGESDTVLEIGSGIGNLTEKIAERAGKVYAIEKDDRLITIAQREANGRNIDYINNDVLKIDIPSFNKSISNLPYRRVEPILEKISTIDFEKAVFTVPYKFARKLNSDSYEGIFAERCNAYYNIEVMDEISKNSFYPSPRHKSNIIKMEPKEDFDFKEEKDLFVTKEMFQKYKRKKAKNAVIESLKDLQERVNGERISNSKARYIVSNFDIEEEELEKRVPQLSSEDFKKLMDNIKSLDF